MTTALRQTVVLDPEALTLWATALSETTVAVDRTLVLFQHFANRRRVPHLLRGMLSRSDEGVWGLGSPSHRDLCVEQDQKDGLALGANPDVYPYSLLALDASQLPPTILEVLDPVRRGSVLLRTSPYLLAYQRLVEGLGLTYAPQAYIVTTRSGADGVLFAYRTRASDIWFLAMVDVRYLTVQFYFLASPDPGVFAGSLTPSRGLSEAGTQRHKAQAPVKVPPHVFRDAMGQNYVPELSGIMATAAELRWTTVEEADFPEWAGQPWVYAGT